MGPEAAPLRAPPIPFPAIPETSLSLSKTRNKAEDEPAPRKLLWNEVRHPAGQNRRKSKRQRFLPYATYGLFHFVRPAL